MFGGGGQQKQSRGHGQQRGRGQQRKTKPSPAREAPPVFEKNDPTTGVVPLGKGKFPDDKSNFPWLMLFYNREAAEGDHETQRLVQLAKQLSRKVLEKAKGAKNGMVFKIGAVDCSGDAALKFCQSKVGKETLLPSFATVLNGSIDVVNDKKALLQTKKLHDYVTDKLLNIDNLIVNCNSMEHIKTRLLGALPTRGHPNIAIMLFTNKHETSPLYASLAYRHRHDGFVAFGESRGSNLVLGKKFGVKKYPMLLALINDERTAEKYEGSLNGESLSSWLDSLSMKHMKSQKKTS